MTAGGVVYLRLSKSFDVVTGDIRFLDGWVCTICKRCGRHVFMGKSGAYFRFRSCRGCGGAKAIVTVED